VGHHTLGKADRASESESSWSPAGLRVVLAAGHADRERCREVAPRSVLGGGLDEVAGLLVGERFGQVGEAEHASQVLPVDHRQALNLVLAIVRSASD
jgi:hypothetical protein